MNVSDSSTPASGDAAESPPGKVPTPEDLYAYTRDFHRAKTEALKP